MLNLLNGGTYRLLLIRSGAGIILAGKQDGACRERMFPLRLPLPPPVTSLKPARRKSAFNCRAYAACALSMLATSLQEHIQITPSPYVPKFMVSHLCPRDDALGWRALPALLTIRVPDMADNPQTPRLHSEPST